MVFIKSYIVNGRKAELQREWRDARSDVLLLLLRVHLILMGRAGVLGDKLIHAVLGRFISRMCEFGMLGGRKGIVVR